MADSHESTLAFLSKHYDTIRRSYDEMEQVEESHRAYIEALRKLHFCSFEERSHLQPLYDPTSDDGKLVLRFAIPIAYEQLCPREGEESATSYLQRLDNLGREMLEAISCIHHTYEYDPTSEPSPEKEMVKFYLDHPKQVFCVYGPARGLKDDDTVDETWCPVQVCFNPEVYERACVKKVCPGVSLDGVCVSDFIVLLAHISKCAPKNLTQDQAETRLTPLQFETWKQMTCDCTHYDAATPLLSLAAIAKLTPEVLKSFNLTAPSLSSMRESLFVIPHAETDTILAWTAHKETLFTMLHDDVLECILSE